MRKLSSLLIGLLCVNAAMPSGAAAQQRQPAPAPAQQKEPETVGDLLKTLLGPTWNVYLMGGVTTTGRFSLQRAVGTNGAILGEQTLKGETGYNIGAGIGGDYLLRQGYRLYYVYGSNDLKFRTNNGDGSSVLDIDTNAQLHSNTIGLELIRYMLPARAPITPYGTLGLVTTWWGLDTSPLVQAPGGATQFRMGASLAFGLQWRASDNIGVRLEAQNYAIGNPFTGKNSYRTASPNSALMLDEPTTVGRWDYRLTGVYYFHKKAKKVEEQP